LTQVNASGPSVASNAIQSQFLRLETAMSVRHIEAFFSPKSIVLIGASHRPHTVGSMIASNLFAAGFDGPIMPVNPRCEAIRSVVTYRDVSDVPIAPDLAVIATPAETVPEIVRSLGARGCRAAVIVSSGFEAKSDDASLRDLLLAAADETGMRIIGPNCLGVIAPHQGINASFSHLMPVGGRIACVMQSGALVASMLEWANSRGIGFSKVISLGDAVDVDFGDMLNYLANDPETDAIFLYIEGLTHARKFMAAARALARNKPIIAMKAGRAPVAAQAVRSHTGAMAGSDRVYSAAFRRAGIVRVDSLEEMFDAAEILGRPRAACGPRLAILTNGGGGGILAADALAESGLELAPLSAATLTALEKALPAQWSYGNPIDIIGDADGARYASSLKIVAADPDVDAVLVINCPTAIASSQEAADAIIESRDQLGGSDVLKPIVACWMGSTANSAARSRLSQAGIPTYETPEQAVKALRFLRDFSLHAAAPSDGVDIQPLSVEDHKKAARPLQDALRDGRSWLDEIDAEGVLEAYGIRVARTVKAATPEAVAEAARKRGAPVAVKILSPDIQHKSDVGGVTLALDTPEAAHDAAVAMAERVAAVKPDARLTGFTVSPMIVRWDGREALAGISTDRTFGPVVVFGQGGIATEQVDDVAVALPPLTMADARELIGQTRFARQLEAFRDWPKADLTAVQKTIVALGQLAIDHPEIAELDINPLVADANGVIALDARIRVKDPAVSVPAAMETHTDHEHAIHDHAGADIAIRSIHPDDAPGVHRFIERLKPESIRARFFETMRRLPPAMLARLTQLEKDREMAFVAVERRRNGDADPEDDRICGVAHIVLDADGKRAEYALTADPDAVRRGIAHALLKEVIAHVSARGVERLCAEELNDSTELIALAQELGAKISHDADDPTIACIALTLQPVAAAA
jgi:acetyltransferase